MSLIASVLTGLIQTSLTTKLAPYNGGVLGPQFVNFTTALGDGINSGIVGSTFTTSDTGSVTNPGAGTGSSITGLVSSTLSTSMYDNCVTLFGSAGARLHDITDAIAESLITHLANAVLTSTHTPVYTGTGVVSFSTSSMDPAVMSLFISTAAPAFTGIHWVNFCNAVSNGVVSHIKSVGSGSVVITGVAPPSPVPGAGVGSGVVS